jgi:hypothetical protein
MAYSTQHGEVEISRLDSVAICKEMSERLAIILKSESFVTPPHLIMLARRLRDKSSLPLHACSCESSTPVSR